MRTQQARNESAPTLAPKMRQTYANMIKIMDTIYTIDIVILHKARLECKPSREERGPAAQEARAAPLSHTGCLHI